jgi:predicted Holliday junction resolvase-like endonuclease
MSEDWRDQETETIRSQSIRRSEAVLRGRMSEQLAPTTDTFPFDPQDARLIGTPIDFVVFDGLAEARTGRRDSLRRIVLVEIKSGQSSLTRIQRRVRDAAAEGRVSFHTLRRRAAGRE